MRRRIGTKCLRVSEEKEFHGCLAAAFRRSKYWIFIAKLVCFLSHSLHISLAICGRREFEHKRTENKFHIIRPLSLSINCSERDFSLVMAGSLAFAAVFWTLFILFFFTLWILFRRTENRIVFVIRKQKIDIFRENLSSSLLFRWKISIISLSFSFSFFHRHSFLIICQM